MEKDFSSATISMDSLAQGYRGVSTYNSVMNSNVKDFVNTCFPSFYYADRNRYTFWDNAMNNWFAAIYRGKIPDLQEQQPGQQQIYADPSVWQYVSVSKCTGKRCGKVL